MKLEKQLLNCINPQIIILYSFGYYNKTENIFYLNTIEFLDEVKQLYPKSSIQLPLIFNEVQT